MTFTVERRAAGTWHLVAASVEAESATQAVARACSEDGVYRAGPLGTIGLREHFLVPAWGPPEPIVPTGKVPRDPTGPPVESGVDCLLE